ncbi:nitroreductase family protein [Vibrio vulnificus]|uniref:nitroreductase family protein n=1 Tax=Vibrio vulnificus TaxID=672 RepID=UPI00092C3869|nr:nitroreductase family protein [Vibrio vulnificus]OJI42875.1 malonic semialdehyde reductase RutE [Vibrio vulnificus]HAS8180516.1 hypothetical protein [Vibrio vulnificus]
MKSFIKKIAPQSVFFALVRIRDDLKYLNLKVSKINKLTAFLSLLFDKAYLNEHYSFLQGAYDYESQVRKGKENRYFLRRNIHRIEKGLVMKPRREVFALRFILETVVVLKDSVGNPEFISSSEFNWSMQVMKEYFNTTTSDDSRYKQARDIFYTISQPIRSESQEIPVRYVNNSNHEMMSLFEKLLRQRKSVRWYSERKIEKEKIEKALQLASLSPSSCNRQPYRYVIKNNKSIASLVAAIPSGTVGWSHNVPCIAVLVADQSAFSNSANRHSIYVDATLSVMPFVLSLESQGLSTCIINWADIPSKEREMSKVLDLKNSEKIVLSISIGYAENDQLVPFSKRKDIEEISVYEE